MNKGQRTRQRIIDVGIERASLGGLSTMTIGELAASVGMSKSGLFAHFGSGGHSDGQFAFELYGVVLTYSASSRLLADTTARAKATAAYMSLAHRFGANPV